MALLGAGSTRAECKFDIAHAAQVLGVPRDAPSDRVSKAYRTRKREAEAARDKEMLARIEKANDTIMMATLTRRMSVRRAPPCTCARLQLVGTSRLAFACSLDGSPLQSIAWQPGCTRPP